MIVDNCFPFIRRPEAYNGLHTWRGLGRIAIAPAAIVANGAAFSACLFTHFLQLCLAGIAIVGVAVLKQLLGYFDMARHSGSLVNGLIIPFKP